MPCEINNSQTPQIEPIAQKNQDIQNYQSTILQNQMSTKLCPQFEYIEALHIPFIIDVNGVDEMQHNPELTFSQKNPEEVLDIIGVYQRVQENTNMTDNYIKNTVLPFNELKNNIEANRKNDKQDPINYPRGTQYYSELPDKVKKIN